MDKKTKITVIGTTIAILIILSVAGVYLIQKFTPNKDRVSISDYFDVSSSQFMITLDDKLYEKRGLWSEGRPYLGLEMVQELFNHRFYWDEKENILVYTTPTEIVNFFPDENYYMENEKKIEVSYPIIKLEKETVYLDMEYLAFTSDLAYQTYENPNRVMIQYQWGDYLYSDVLEDTVMRISNSIKSEILMDLAQGSKIRYIDSGGSQENGFVKVISQDGILGYVQTKYLTESYYEKIESNYVAPEYTSLQRKTPIYLGWQLLYTKDSVSNLEIAAAKAKEMNTVAPCWFYLNSSKEGTLLSYANAEYVKKAHELGLEVWATFKNDNLEDVFSGTKDTYTLLKSTKARTKLVASIVQAAKDYNLDGVNIDFEMLSKETGPHFIQFLRELSVFCRNEKIVLSVDNYVPASYNAFYDLEEQGELVDYVVIMSYDEHYSGSEEAGSVASIGFVKKAIQDTIEMVPSNKVIMGVPFYTRLWKESKENGKEKVQVETNLTMAAADELIKKMALKPEWDEETAQYYGEYQKEDVRFRVWFEEEKSLEAKVSLMRKAEVAGVAAWKLGDEKEGTWELIKSIMEP